MGFFLENKYHQRKLSDPNYRAVIDAMAEVQRQIDEGKDVAPIDPIYIPIGEYKPISREEIAAMSRSELEELAYDLGQSVEAHIARIKKASAV